ncbi:hypothetical protein ACODT5_28635 [Streptomyces sp. 5.8]|uniref:hypothetical protein n=1 Tax=Streptomyces sp. 5.8 TaxID=3406571 RepID=UPI003BB66807
MTDRIPVLTPDAHHSIDWNRVRATVRALRPVRTLTLISAAMFPAVVWAEQVAIPVSAEVGVNTAFAIACITSTVCAVGMATGGRIRRWASAALLMAAVGGTLLAAPTRHLMTIWIVGA